LPYGDRNIGEDFTDLPDVNAPGGKGSGTGNFRIKLLF